VGFSRRCVGNFVCGSVAWGSCRVPALVVLLVISGCGQATGPVFAPVTGRVTFNGQPLEEGTIHFFPDESQGTSGPMSMAAMQNDGRYSLRGPGKYVGAIVGNHRVYLTMPFPELGPTPVVIDGEVVVQEPPRNRPVSMAFRIPKKYLQPETTEWTAAVVKGAANLFDFEITK
jgi:hypothetical protein